MKKIRLKSGTDVLIKGKDYRGFPAGIRFRRAPQDGWYWHPSPEGPLIPITTKIVRYYRVFGFLYLRQKRSFLAVWEHIGSMAFMGLTGVIVEGSGHPPYHGRVLELWSALKPHFETTNEEVKWCRPTHTVEWRYPRRDGFTRFAPHADPTRHSLDVTIMIDYPSVGKLTKDFSFPNAMSLLETSFQVHAQGYPKEKYPFAKLISILGWPHLNSAVWPHRQSPAETLELFIRHRLVDLLGALSLCGQDRLLAGKVISICSGHLADLNALRQATFVPC